jgi:hypothetical protein
MEECSEENKRYARHEGEEDGKYSDGSYTV